MEIQKISKLLQKRLGKIFEIFYENTEKILSSKEKRKKSGEKILS